MLLNHEVTSAYALTASTWKISRRVRADDHPDTLACAVNAALDRQESANDLEARQELQQTLDRLERILGTDHPDTVDAVRGKRADCDVEPPPT
jgi:hypothetical protein